MPAVSIIIPAWNAADFIGHAIASARTQTLTDIEIVVVNDQSTDETSAAVLRAAAGDSRVKLIEQSVNGGPAVARNAALDAASGEWLAVLDADDAMAPNRLEVLVAAASRHRADVVADDLLLVNETIPYTEQTPGKTLLRLRDEVLLDLPAYARSNKMFSRSAQTGYLKPMFRADFLARHNLRYDPAVRIGEDYMIAASALALGARYALLPQALYHYSVRDGSISRRMNAKDMNALIAADERFMTMYIDTMTPAARDALAHRRASLEDAAAFIDAVEALKARRFADALKSALRRPASVRHFGMPIGARLTRWFAPTKASPLQRDVA